MLRNNKKEPHLFAQTWFMSHCELPINILTLIKNNATRTIYIQMGKIKDVFNAYIFKNTKLVSKEEYPLLEYKYISRELPKNIIPFDKIKYCKIPKETYVCFYCQDKNFLKVILKPCNI